MRWQITQAEVDAVPPLTNREKFLYICMSLIFNPVVMSLPRKRRDDLLVSLNDKIAHVSPAEWYVIFHSIEDMRPILVSHLADLLDGNEMLQIKDGFMNLLGPNDRQSVQGMVDSILGKIKP